MSDMFIPATGTPLDSTVARKLLEAAGDRVIEVRVRTWPSVGWSVPSDIYETYLALIRPPAATPKRGKK
jgi:hypothetical protein